MEHAVITLGRFVFGLNQFYGQIKESQQVGDIISRFLYKLVVLVC